MAKQVSVHVQLATSAPFDVVTIAGCDYMVLANNKRRWQALLQVLDNINWQGTVVVEYANCTARAYALLKCRSCGQETWVRWSFARRGFSGRKLCKRCDVRMRKQKSRWKQTDQYKRLVGALPSARS